MDLGMVGLPTQKRRYDVPRTTHAHAARSRRCDFLWRGEVEVKVVAELKTEGEIAKMSGNGSGPRTASRDVLCKGWLARQNDDAAPIWPTQAFPRACGCHCDVLRRRRRLSDVEMKYIGGPLQPRRRDVASAEAWIELWCFALRLCTILFQGSWIPHSH